MSILGISNLAGLVWQRGATSAPATATAANLVSLDSGAGKSSPEGALATSSGALGTVLSRLSGDVLNGLIDAQEQHQGTHTNVRPATNAGTPTAGGASVSGGLTSEFIRALAEKSGTGVTNTNVHSMTNAELYRFADAHGLKDITASFMTDSVPVDRSPAGLAAFYQAKMSDPTKHDFVAQYLGAAQWQKSAGASDGGEDFLRRARELLAASAQETATGIHTNDRPATNAGTPTAGGASVSGDSTPELLRALAEKSGTGVTNTNVHSMTYAELYRFADAHGLKDITGSFMVDYCPVDRSPAGYAAMYRSMMSDPTKHDFVAEYLGTAQWQKNAGASDGGEDFVRRAQELLAASAQETAT